MNILVFSWRDPKHPMAGGAEQVMHEHMKGWVDAGHRVTLFTSFFPGSLHREELDKVTIIRFGRQLLDVHIRAFAWYLFAKHEKFDLVVDQFHGIPFFTPLYVRKPIIAVVQEVARNVWMKNHLPVPFNFLFGLVGLITEPIYYFFYKNAFFITGSNSAKSDVIEMGVKPQKIEIVSHGVKLDLPKSLPKKENIKTIVFLGAIAKDKGIEDALQSFKILQQKGEYQFWVIGRAGSVYMSEINKLVKNLGLGKSTVFWGYVPEKEKFKLLARAHVMINPSAHEGWGLVNIEANSVGTPVVAYPSAGLVDSVIDGKSGVICSESTPVSLANSVVGLLDDSLKLNRLSIGAIAWSKQFDWKSSRAKSLEIINKVVKQS